MAVRRAIRLQRINRSQFLTDVGALIMIVLIALMGVIYINPIDFTGGIRPLIQSMMNLISLQYYLLGGSGLLSIVFAYLYLGRMMDRGISPWLAIFPLLLCFGSGIYFFYHLILLLQETNYLQLFAKAKRFLDNPSIANFQPLFSDEWRNFLDQKKIYLDTAILAMFFILITGIIIPGNQGENGYGMRSADKLSRIIIGLVVLMILLIPLFYIGIQILLIDTPSQYFRDYDAFLHLLHSIQG